MRNVVYAINLSLDGCCDHTKGIVDEELFDYYIQLVRDADLLVYGRKTYQLMVPYWADVAKNPSETKSDIAFGKTFVSKNKVVFSYEPSRRNPEIEAGARQIYFSRWCRHSFTTDRAWSN